MSETHMSRSQGVMGEFCGEYTAFVFVVPMPADCAVIARTAIQTVQHGCRQGGNTRRVPGTRSLARRIRVRCGGRLSGIYAQELPAGLQLESVGTPLHLVEVTLAVSEILRVFCLPPVGFEWVRYTVPVQQSERCCGGAVICRADRPPEHRASASAWIQERGAAARNGPHGTAPEMGRVSIVAAA